MTYWELELQELDDQFMFDIFKNQIKEANSFFASFIEKNYSKWITNDSTQTVLSNNLFKKKILPFVKEDQPSILLLIDNLRLDQWRVISPLIQQFYNLESDECYLSILPTATQYSRNSIFSGLTPKEMQKKFPKWWKNDNEEGGKNSNEKESKTDEKEKSYQAAEIEIKTYINKNKVEGLVLLKNARIITMNGKEIIENGEILIKNNRIVEVGDADNVQLEESVWNDVKTIDLSGKTIVPGFVDTHAHVRVSRNIHRAETWSFAANLAYGVTTVRDPQTGTTDILSYGDMVDAGLMHGPRIYSTGPGVGYWGYNLKSLEQTKDVLKNGDPTK